MPTPSSAPRTHGGSSSSWTSCHATPRSSTRGFASIPNATSGLTAAGRRTTGSQPSAGPRGRAIGAAAGGTCTRSIRSSPTSTGAALRAGAGEGALLVGEVYLPASALGPYLEHLDVAFAFELLHAPWQAAIVRAAIEHALDPAGAAGRVAWVLSNHDFPRLPDRVGMQNTRAAVLLCLTLPGPAFIYQGDEIGMADGPGREPPDDRAGRDRHRHPMRWDDDEPHGGFTTGEPWLPAIDVDGGAVAAQRLHPDSTLALYRDLIACRRELGDGLRFVDAADGVLAYRRGCGRLVAINLAGEHAGPRAGIPRAALISQTNRVRAIVT